MFHLCEWATISCSPHIHGKMSFVDQNPLVELSCRQLGGVMCIYTASATIRLAGPASSLCSNGCHSVCWSHACTSSWLYTSPSPVNIWNSPAIKAAKVGWVCVGSVQKSTRSRREQMHHVRDNDRVMTLGKWIIEEIAFE